MCFTTNMFLWILFYQLEKCLGSRVELNIIDKSGSKMKLICQPPNNKSLENTNETSNVLWEGVKFGPDEQKTVALNVSSNISIPNLNLNALRMKCRLKAIKSKENIETKLLDDGEARQLRETAGGKVHEIESGISKEETTREKREMAGTIQTETGNCPPGHRIDQDRCFPCFPGSYTSGQETECFLCPRDFYSSKEGADMCFPCPEGRKTRKEGADSKEACIDRFVKVHEQSTFSMKWIILIILLIIFLICAWILNICLWIRLFGGRRSETSAFRKDEETGLRNLIQTPPGSDQKQKYIQPKGKHICKRHKAKPNIRKQLMFDIDIKGSAILTDKNSTSSECEDTCIADDRSEVAENSKEDATEVELGNSAGSSTNLSKTSNFNDGQTYLFSDSSENKTGEFVVESDIQKNMAENDPRDLGRIHEKRIDADQSNDNEEISRGSENEITAKESDRFNDISSDIKSHGSVYNSESSKKNSEDHMTSNGYSLSEDFQHEYEEKVSIEFIPKDSESIIKQMSAEKPFGQNGKDHLSNNSLFSKREADSTKWYPEKSRDIPVREKGDENQNQRHQYQITNNVSHRNEGVAFKKTNLTEPTSCPLHSYSSNHCHVDVEYFLC